MKNIYEAITGIFSKSMENIIDGLYRGAHSVYTNDFFEAALAISIAYIGFMIAFRKLKDEEMAYKIIWTLFMFSLVYTILYQRTSYDFLLELVDMPRDAFIALIKTVVTGLNNEATIENIITRIYSANNSLASYLYSISSWSNLAPLIYANFVWIAGTFLLLVILFTAVFSVFLSQIILALLPLLLPFLIWKKTEYIFFNWVKLYISVSLYAPFTLLFGIISIETANVSIHTLNIIQNDFSQSAGHISSLIIVQLLTALAIFKIPNIINQLIGSSNEGSSLTSGIGTISAGGAIMSTVAKYSGLNIAGKAAGKGAVKAGGKIANGARDFKNKIQMR